MPPRSEPGVDYGVDAPGVIRNLALAALAAALLAVFAHPAHFSRPAALTMAVLFGLEAGLMLHYSWVGKFIHRDRMLAGVPDWDRVHTALDVGTGRGLLLAAIARRIAPNPAIGVDIWQAADLSGNSLAATQRNLDRAGVGAHAQLRSEDARHLSFADASFDLVVSNLCLHNINGRDQRRLACAEIARVLSPGGVALISDFKHTGEYADEFRRLGLTVRRTPFRLRQFPPLRTVIATRATSSLGPQ